MGREQYRSEPRPCELCGQLVVSVCDSLDMGDAVTCHYEPATEDEKAKRIAELEEENAALRSRLEFTSCQKADVEAQVLELEEQNAALDEEKVCCLPDDISARLRRAPVMPFEEVTLDRPERRWEIRERRPDGSVYVTYGDKFIDAITEAWRNCKVT